MRHLVGVLVFSACLLPQIALAQVLGPCGTPQAEEPGAAVATAPAASVAPTQTVSRIPLPGEKAPNFQLPAVIGGQVKTVKLSDYDGKWRAVCFYPADFTFV
jgi:hypothetical protein